MICLLEVEGDYSDGVKHPLPPNIRELLWHVIHISENDTIGLIYDSQTEHMMKHIERHKHYHTCAGGRGQFMGIPSWIKFSELERGHPLFYLEVQRSYNWLHKNCDTNTRPIVDSVRL